MLRKKPDVPGGIHIGFQTRFSPVPRRRSTSPTNIFASPIHASFFIGSARTRAARVCILLGDPWFNDKTESDGFVLRNDWGIAFHPGQKIEIEEITDMRRWIRRIRRERPLHDVDFCMTLAAVDELQIHGRVLTPGRALFRSICSASCAASSRTRSETGC